jgi:hypothetical protein
VISAADLTSGDGAAEVGIFTFFTIAALWLAHSYAIVLGKWSSDGVTPSVQSTKAALNKELPMIAAPLLPINVLVLGSFVTSADQVLINLASAICVLELGATAFFSSGRSAAGMPLRLLATLVATALGASIILLKILLHG